MKKLSFLLISIGLLTMTSCNRTPTATFTADAISVSAGDVVTFTNTSEDAYNSVWDFGDGTQSETYSPTHVYANTGTYAVTLQVENKRGSEVIVSTATTISVDSASADPLPAASLTLTADKSEVDFYEYVSFIASARGHGDVLYYVWTFKGSSSDYTAVTTIPVRSSRSYDQGTLNVSVTAVYDPEQGIEPITSSLTIEIDSPDGTGIYDQNADLVIMRNNLAGEWNLEDEDFDYDQEVGGYDDYDVDLDRDYQFYASNRIFKTENDPSFSGNRLTYTTWSHIIRDVISADGYWWVVSFDGNEMTWTREQFINYNDLSMGQEYDIRLTVNRTFVRK